MHLRLGTQSARSEMAVSRLTAPTDRKVLSSIVPFGWFRKAFARIVCSHARKITQLSKIYPTLTVNTFLH